MKSKAANVHLQRLKIQTRMKIKLKTFLIKAICICEMRRVNLLKRMLAHSTMRISKVSQILTLSRTMMKKVKCTMHKSLTKDKPCFNQEQGMENSSSALQKCSLDTLHSCRSSPKRMKSTMSRAWSSTSGVADI
jgi:hypothetical protein